MNIKWVFFDIGGVLADESKFLEIRQNYNWEAVNFFEPEVTKEEVLKVWSEASRMIGGLDENVIKLVLKNQEFLQEALDLMKQKRKYSPRYYDLLKIRPEACEVIPKLAKKYKIGIIANQSEEARDKLKDAGILEYFINTDVSANFGVSKPDIKYFQKVFELTNASPTESVMIDDNIERGLEPAKKLGMMTVWYNSNNSRDIPMNVVDFKVESLNDLLNFL